ncbi:MAG: hypothetical protein WDN03_17475 [Rhizomicrobium sp.]
MVETHDYESDLLELATSKLVSEGYRVLLQPDVSELPKELVPFRPDGIAIGKIPNLVIEIAREGKNGDTIKKMRQVLATNPSWELHVIFDRSDASSPLAQETLDSIEQLLGEVAEVASKDTRAALLMCWAALEALARIIEPSNFARPQTPGRIVEQLASLAYIVPSEAQFLRDRVHDRNEFVHGGLSVKVTEAEVARFVELLEDLLRATRNQGH